MTNETDLQRMTRERDTVLVCFLESQAHAEELQRRVDELVSQNLRLLRYLMLETGNRTNQQTSDFAAWEVEME